jgi:hypothetical protein
MYDVPEIQYGLLANLGNTFNAAQDRGRRLAQEQKTLAALQGMTRREDGSFDYGTGAMNILQQGGDPQQAMTLARLAEIASQNQYARQTDARDFNYRQGQDEIGNVLKMQTLKLSQTKTPEQEAEGRKRAAEGLGLTPNSPAYNSYVLTGKMPREDQAPLTATDKNAILESDEKVMQGTGVINNLKKAQEINDKAFSGPAASTRGYIASQLGLEGGAETQQYENLVGEQALGNLKAIFGGNPTEGERKILLDLQASANKSPEVRRALLQQAEQAAQRRLDFSKQQAEQLRSGTYYGGQGGKRQGQQQLQQPAQQNLEGRTATGRDGQKLIFKGGQWVDAGRGM